MALLLNRKYGSRLECLYYILQITYNRFGKNEFNMKDIKFDEAEENVFSNCNLLLTRMGRKYCPFLNNPLNASKCYATQSVESDTTKQKAVSDVARSLEALGFIFPTDSGFCISDNGVKWIESDFTSKEWFEMVREAVLSYGVTVGFLHKITTQDNPFNSSKIYLGYPFTDDPEELSSNSTKDTNTRTVSRVVSWCVTAGLIEPVGVETNESSDLPQIKYRNFINAAQLRVRLYNKTNILDDVFKNKRYVNNPLSYNHLNKNVGSIRERGSDKIRKRTLENNDKILSRRFIFVYVLNKLSKIDKSLDFKLFITELSKYEDVMFLPGSDIGAIMQTEAEIADICGIPFDILNDSLLPKTIINEKILVQGAPAEIIKIANKIFEALS